jgi:hypothetical protein
MINRSEYGECFDVHGRRAGRKVCVGTIAAGGGPMVAARKPVSDAQAILVARWDPEGQAATGAHRNADHT